MLELIHQEDHKKIKMQSSKFKMILIVFAPAAVAATILGLIVFTRARDMHQAALPNIASPSATPAPVTSNISQFKTVRGTLMAIEPKNFVIVKSSQGDKSYDLAEGVDTSKFKVGARVTLVLSDDGSVIDILER